MPYIGSEALVSTNWLAENINNQNVILIDASLPRVGVTEDTRANYRAAHIPNAIFFDIDKIADLKATLPHMMPNETIFGSKVAELGISNDSRVIVYDQHGIYSAPRAWWMFRAFGHTNVAVLDGGFPKWKAEGRGVTDIVPSIQAAQFTANLDKGLLRLATQVNQNIASENEQVVDARSAGRYSGTDPELRPGIRSGHIPKSLNIPYDNIINDGSMVDAAKLEAAFVDGGVDLNKPITASCGSGITACILALGLYLNGRDDVAVYDGSWTEWGGRQDLPIEK